MFVPSKEDSRREAMITVFLLQRLILWTASDLDLSFHFPLSLLAAVKQPGAFLDNCQYGDLKLCYGRASSLCPYAS